MRRNEFVNEITSFAEFLEVCGDVDYETDVYDEDEKDEVVNSNLEYIAQEFDWKGVRDILRDIPEYEQSGYYRMDGTMDWVPLDEGEDLEYYVQELMEYIDDNYPEYWDDEEDEEFYDEEEIELPCEEITMMELMRATCK